MRANTHVLEVRRTPQQVRSQRRVEKILEAAAAVMSEVGFEAATTNAIAERAGVSIGSLYQFFPNKAAILYALNARCLDDLHVTLDNAFTSEAPLLPIETFIDRIVAILGDFQTRYLGLFRVINAAAHVAGLESVEAAFSLEIATRIERLLEHHFPAMPPERRAVVSIVCFRTCDALLHLSSRGDAAFREAVLAEVKTILLAYTDSLRTAGGR